MGSLGTAAEMAPAASAAEATAPAPGMEAPVDR